MLKQDLQPTTAAIYLLAQISIILLNFSGCQKLRRKIIQNIFRETLNI